MKRRNLGPSRVFIRENLKRPDPKLDDYRIYGHDRRFAIRFREIDPHNRIKFDCYHRDAIEPFIQSTTQRFASYEEALNAVGKISIGLYQKGILPNISTCGRTVKFDAPKVRRINDGQV